jgi:hypothetical protein
MTDITGAQHLYSDHWEGDHDNGKWVSRPHRIVDVQKDCVIVEYIPPIPRRGETITFKLCRQELEHTGCTHCQKAKRTYYTSPISATKRDRKEEQRLMEQREKDKWDREEQVRERIKAAHQRLADERRARDEARQRLSSEERARLDEEDWRRFDEEERAHRGRRRGPRFRPQYLIDLDLPAGATLDQVKKKYRQLAMQHHPDRFGDPEVFKRVQSAFEAAVEAFSVVRVGG